MNINDFIDELITELAFRLDSGIPDLKKKSHLELLEKILIEWNMSEIGTPLLQILNEEEPQQQTSKEDEKYSHKAYGYYVRKGDEDKEDAQMYRKEDDGSYVSVSRDEYDEKAKEQGELGAKASGAPTDTPTDGSETQQQPQTGTALDPNTEAGKEYTENLPEDDPARVSINEAGFTYSELTKSGGKYLPQFLAHIRSGNEFELDGKFQGERDTLVKSNLDLKGFGDKSLLQVLSGGTKSDVKQFFKTNTTPILVGKSGRKYSLNQISKSTFTGQGGGEKPTDAAYYEMGISVEYNKLKGMSTDNAKKVASVDPKKYSKYEKHLTEVCSKIAKNLPNVGPSLRQTGGDSFTPATGWPSTDKTPKTDILGNSSNRISVKKSGGSQLVSGKGGDAKGIFKAGLGFYEKYDSADAQSHIENVINNIEKDFKTYNSENQVGDIRKKAGEAFIKWRVPQIKKI